jgi:small subunit ribosomal protein S4
MTDKCAFKRNSNPPGIRKSAAQKLSDYGLQLHEKQKLRRIYGVQERQFRNYFEKAERMKGLTGENLLILLERRLDNVMYRLGCAESRAQARQLVNHGHVFINNRKVDIPSFLVKDGAEISIKKNSISRIKKVMEATSGRLVPAWLEVDRERCRGRVLRLPKREDIDLPINEQLVVVYYSR